MRGALAWRGGSAAALFVPVLVVSALALAYLAAEQARAAWLRVPPLARVSAQTVLLGILTYALLLTRGGRQGFFYAQF